MSTYKGKPCRTCESVLRFVSSDNCVDCARKSAREYRLKNTDRLRERNRQWKQRNKKRASELNSKSYKKCHRANPAKLMLSNAKRRAFKKNLKFNLKLKDIVVPVSCPVLGIPIFVGEGKFGLNSPTLDRIDNNKGYVRGNVICVSAKANSIKNCASTKELRKVAKFYTNLEKKNGKTNSRRRPKPVLPVLQEAVFQSVQDLPAVAVLKGSKPANRRTSRSVVLQSSLASNAIN